MKALIALALVVGLTGCAGMQHVFDAGASVTAAALRDAEDSNIRLWTFNACATPLSAAIRNPQIIPALRALCLPGGGESSPVLLLGGTK
jgi:hypothetical protein